VEIGGRISNSIQIFSFYFLLGLLRPVPVAGQTDAVSWALAGYSIKLTATDLALALIWDKRVVPFEFRLMLPAGGSGTMYQAAGGEVSTNTNELHLMADFRVMHPKEYNNHHCV